MVQFNTVIFDFGGVLVDWDPRYLYRNIFKDENEMEFFLTDVCPFSWNSRLDEGADIHKAMEEKINLYPKYEAQIKAYWSRWPEMMKDAIHGSVQILTSLKKAKFRLYGLTNWSHQTFPFATQRFDFFQLFDGIVVSGDEKVIKPNPGIYEILLSRYNIIPEKSIFIDDSEKNITAANELGIHGLYFTEPKELDLELRKLIHY